MLRIHAHEFGLRKLPWSFCQDDERFLTPRDAVSFYEAWEQALAIRASCAGEINYSHAPIFGTTRPRSDTMRARGKAGVDLVNTFTYTYTHPIDLDVTEHWTVGSGGKSYLTLTLESPRPDGLIRKLNAFIMAADQFALDCGTTLVLAGVTGRWQ